MDKILPKPHPRFILLTLLNGMNVVGEINAETTNYADPDVLAEMPPTASLVVRRPLFFAMKQVSQTEAQIVMQPVVPVPHKGEDGCKPFLRSQVLFVTEPSSDELHKKYLKQFGAGLDIVQSLGAVGAALKR